MKNNLEAGSAPRTATWASDNPFNTTLSSQTLHEHGRHALWIQLCAVKAVAPWALPRIRKNTSDGGWSTFWQPQIWHKMWTTTSNNRKKNTAFSCFQIPIKRLTHVFIWQLEEYTIFYLLLDARGNWTWRVIRLFCAVKSDNKQTFTYFEQQFGTLGFTRIPCFVCIWRCDVTVCEQLWAWNSSTIGNRMLFLRVEGDPLALWYTNASLNQHYVCLRPIHAREVHDIVPQSKDRSFFTSLLGKVSAVHDHKFLKFPQQLCMRHDLGKTSGRLTACLLQSSA